MTIHSDLMTIDRMMPADTSDALTGFIALYNKDLESHEATQDLLEQAMDKIIDLKSLIKEKELDFDEIIESKDDEIKLRTADVDLVIAASKEKDEHIADLTTILSQAEKVTEKAMIQKEQLATANAKCNEQKQEISKLTAVGSPARVKALADRQKVKNLTLTADNKQKTSANKELIATNKKLEHRITVLELTVLNQQRQLAQGSVNCIYQDGKSYLFTWPLKIIAQNKDKSEFISRSLLYVHQSGRAALYNFNPEKQEGQLCSAPAGGLKPTKNTHIAAQDWLYNVNELHGGKMTDDDYRPMALESNDIWEN